MTAKELLIMNQEALEIMAGQLVNASDGHLRLAYREDDSTDAFVGEAGHFLKLDGHRLGPDLELYAFMGTLQGDQPTLCDIFDEIIMPLKRDVPASYTVGVECMRMLGRRVFSAQEFAHWESILDM